jgi:predicted negative regulator of RcsB-dependent stress response
MLQQLGRSLTDEQRDTFRRRIADLRGDLAAFQGESQQANFACHPARV